MPPNLSVKLPSKKPCPYCNNSKIYSIRRNKFKCSACRKEWSPRKGTDIEHSTLSYRKYTNIIELINDGYSVSYITRKLKCYYYSVYKIYYKIKKESIPHSKYILKLLKSKTQETNFSLSQSTGISQSTIAKVVSPRINYKVNQKNFYIIYDHLTKEAKYVTKLNNRKASELTTKIILKKPLSSLFKIKRHLHYAVDILLLTNLTGVNQYTKTVPDKFFFDYLYKTNINKNSMTKVLLTLKKNQLINYYHGSLLKSNYPVSYYSKRKQQLLISSIALYFNKIKDYPSAFGWSLLTNNKKIIDEYLKNCIMHYENFSDICNLKKSIVLYETKFKRTSKILYTFLLYEKLFISLKQEISIPKKLRYFFLILKSFGIFQNQVLIKLIKSLEYEIHSTFILLYDTLRYLNCINLAIFTKDYYLKTLSIYNKKYDSYHYIVSNFQYIFANRIIDSTNLITTFETKQLLDESKYIQNAYYINILFYYLCMNKNLNIQKYWELLEQNGTESMSLTNYLIRLEALCIYFINHKLYKFAFIAALHWFDEQYDNKIDAFNIFVYLRIILPSLNNDFIMDMLESFFKKHKAKKPYISVVLDKEKALKGLEQLLKMCKVHVQLNSINFDSLINWLDNFMIAFRQKTYTKKMLKSSTYLFIRKIRKIDKTIESKSAEEFLPILKSILSHNPNETANPIPHASSENLILLHSSYYCLYEHLFLAEKTVSKKFPPIVPHYIQRLLEQR